MKRYHAKSVSHTRPRSIITHEFSAETDEEAIQQSLEMAGGEQYLLSIVEGRLTLSGIEQARVIYECYPPTKEANA